MNQYSSPVGEISTLVEFTGALEFTRIRNEFVVKRMIMGSIM
jgi:hypothetical protein